MKRKTWLVVGAVGVLAIALGVRHEGRPEAARAPATKVASAPAEDPIGGLIAGVFRWSSLGGADQAPASSSTEDEGPEPNQIPASAVAPPPPIDVALALALARPTPPPNPIAYSPPMDNVGGVDGDRPPRDVPGLP